MKILKRFSHVRIKYSFLLIIPLIQLILLPAISCADDDRISKESSDFIEALKQETQSNPDDVGAHSILGYACFRSSMYKEAIETYKQTIRINPDYATAHFVLGFFYFVFKQDRNSALEQ